METGRGALSEGGVALLEPRPAWSTGLEAAGSGASAGAGAFGARLSLGLGAASGAGEGGGVSLMRIGKGR
jgi:hypothetical protein